MSQIPAYLQLILPLAVPFVVGLLTREIAEFGSYLVAKLRKNPKTAPLEEVVRAGEDVLVASVQAAAQNYQKGFKIALPIVEDAALTALKNDRGDLIVAAGAEIAALSGQSTGGVAVAPGGASVNLPST